MLGAGDRIRLRALGVGWGLDGGAFGLLGLTADENGAKDGGFGGGGCPQEKSAEEEDGAAGQHERIILRSSVTQCIVARRPWSRDRRGV